MKIRQTRLFAHRNLFITLLSLRTFLIFAIFFSIVPSVWANMRAPRFVAWMPSSALQAPSANIDLTVEHENLRFLCGTTDCKVSANYQVKAERPVKVQLQFILPVQKPVTVLLANSPKPVSVTSATPLRDQYKDGRVEQIFSDFDSRGSSEYPLFQAMTEVALVAGLNDITFEYLQPLGAFERDYGYFKDGRMVSKFAYILWPLQEWKRVPNFQIDLHVEIEREAPSRLKQWFGTVREIFCKGAEEQIDLHPKRQQRGAKYEYDAILQGNIPQILLCYIGDNDLVK